ncbi:MAG: DUF2142 domain-containing protein [Chloroflexi bacterium]|nr:DUF2142 domain-containing protein [Chloroflexota bacterium]
MTDTAARPAPSPSTGTTVVARQALAEHRLALAVLVLFVGLGGLYLLITPPFEAPDEPAHYRYVRYLAEERRLPPLVYSSDDWEQGEMHQPPLHYILGALVAGGADGPDWEAAYPRNPHATVGDPAAPGNPNAVLHRATPAGVRTERALGRVRALSLGWAAATVWMTYLLARTLYPGRQGLALGAMGLLAANPQFLFIGASASNDPSVTALTTGVLLLAARVARGEGRPVSTPLAMGLVAGLAALAKIGGLAAWGLIPGAYGLAYVARPREGDGPHAWPDLVRPILLAFLAAGAVGGWWYARNGLLYGDPLGMRAHHTIFSGEAQGLSLLATVRTALEALPSYWGVFGWMNVLAPEAFYIGVRALTAAGVGGLVVGAWRARRRPSALGPATRRAVALAALWIVVMGGVALVWTQSSTRIQGRLLFPAASAIACLLAAGLAAWFPRRLRGWALGVVVLGLAGWAIFVPFGVIGPAYAPPPRVAPDDIPADVRPLGIHYGGGEGDGEVVLLGYRPSTRDASPGDTVQVTLYWQAPGPVAGDFVVGATLVGPGGERLGGVDTHPAMGLYPTSAWLPGEVVVDDLFLPVDAALEGPVAADLRVGLYLGEHTASLEARDGAANALGPSPAIGRARVSPRDPAPVPAPEYLLDVTFGAVALRGYDLAVEADPAGDSLVLTLHWECLAEMAEAYTVMVHVVGADGEPLAYGDGPPLGGALPTDHWRPGDVLRDAHTVALPAGALDGSLAVRVGLYRLETFERLPAAGEGAAGDHVVVGVRAP